MCVNYTNRVHVHPSFRQSVLSIHPVDQQFPIQFKFQYHTDGHWDGGDKKKNELDTKWVVVFFWDPGVTSLAHDKPLGVINGLKLIKNVIANIKLKFRLIRVQLSGNEGNPNPPFTIILLLLFLSLLKEEALFALHRLFWNWWYSHKRKTHFFEYRLGTF